MQTSSKRNLTKKNERMVKRPSLILIPSVALFPAEEWGVLSRQSISYMWRSSSKVRVLAFEHRLCINDAFSWQEVLDAGGRLLDSLVELDEASEVCLYSLLHRYHS